MLVASSAVRPDTSANWTTGAINDLPVTIDDIRRRLKDVPRVSLALTPTPLHEAPRLARAIGLNRLFIKRDDLTGLAFGGNKTRNLEFRMADAVAKKADVFIAGLESQSNSARQVTAASNVLGSGESANTCEA